MAEDTAVKPDADFFALVNQYLDLTREQSAPSGPQRPSVAALFAAARFNAYVFLGTVPADAVGQNRQAWLDHTTTMFRRMLNENLDGLGREHNVDVGVSEFATTGAQGFGAGDAASTDVPARTSAAEYVAAAGAMPPSNDPQVR